MASYTWKFVRNLTEYGNVDFDTLVPRHRFINSYKATLDTEKVVVFTDNESLIGGTVYTPYGEDYTGYTSYGEHTDNYYSYSRSSEWDAIKGAYVHKIYKSNIYGTLLSTTIVGKLDNIYGPRPPGGFGGYDIESFIELSPTTLFIIGKIWSDNSRVWVAVTIGSDNTNTNGVEYKSSSGYSIIRHKNYNADLYFQDVNLDQWYWNGTEFVNTGLEGPIKTFTDSYPFLNQDTSSPITCYTTYTSSNNIYMQPFEAYPYSGTYRILNPPVIRGGYLRYPVWPLLASNVYHNNMPIISTSFGQVHLYDSGAYAPLFSLDDWDQDTCDLVAWQDSLVNPIYNFNMVRYFPTSGSVYGIISSNNDVVYSLWKYTPNVSRRASLGKYTVAAHKI